MQSTSPQALGSEVAPTPVTVEQMAAHVSFDLTPLAGQGGKTRAVEVPRIQKPGLALTGWPEQLHPRRALVFVLLGPIDGEGRREHNTELRPGQHKK